ncbi:hypothetical protein NHX12_034350, partial [Muraenolepis orangiensis]
GDREGCDVGGGGTLCGEAGSVQRGAAASEASPSDSLPDSLPDSLSDFQNAGKAEKTPTPGEEEEEAFVERTTASDVVVREGPAADTVDGTLLDAEDGGKRRPPDIKKPIRRNRKLGQRKRSGCSGSEGEPETMSSEESLDGDAVLSKVSVSPVKSPRSQTERLEETMSVRELMRAFQTGQDPSKKKSGLFEHKALDESRGRDISEIPDTDADTLRAALSGDGEPQRRDMQISPDRRPSEDFSAYIKAELEDSPEYQLFKERSASTTDGDCRRRVASEGNRISDDEAASGSETRDETSDGTEPRRQKPPRDTAMTTTTYTDPIAEPLLWQVHVERNASSRRVAVAVRKDSSGMLSLLSDDLGRYLEVARRPPATPGSDAAHFVSETFEEDNDSVCREEAVDDDGDTLPSSRKDDYASDETAVVVGDGVDSEGVTTDASATEITRIIQSGDFKEQACREEAVNDDGHTLNSSRKNDDMEDDRTAVVVGDGVDSEDITTVASATEITRIVQSRDFKEQECRGEALDDDGDALNLSSRGDEDNTDDRTEIVVGDASVDETAFQEIRIERHNSSRRSSEEKDMSGMLSLLGDDLHRLESEMPVLKRQPEGEEGEDLILEESFEQVILLPRKDDGGDAIHSSSRGGDENSDEETAVVIGDGVDSEDITTEITRIVQGGDFKEQECREEAVDDDGDEALHSWSRGDDTTDDRTAVIVGDGVDSEDITTEITQTVKSGDFKEQECREEVVDDDGDTLPSSRKEDYTNDKTAVVVGDGVDSEDITTDASATEITRGDFKEEECDNDSVEVKAVSTSASVDETKFQEIRIERHNSSRRSSEEKDMSGMLSLLGDDLDRLESETPALQRQLEGEEGEDLILEESFEQVILLPRKDDGGDAIHSSSRGGDENSDEETAVVIGDGVDSEDITTEITRIVQGGDFKEQECREEAVDDDGDEALHSWSRGDDTTDDRTAVIVGDGVDSEDITTEITQTVKSGDFKEQECREEVVDDDGDTLPSSRKEDYTNDKTAVVVGDGVDSEDITTDASATEITRGDFKEEECDNDSVEVKAVSTSASVDETKFQEIRIERHNSSRRSSEEKDMSGMLSLLGDDLDRLESETPALQRQLEGEEGEDLILEESFEQVILFPRKDDGGDAIHSSSRGEDENTDEETAVVLGDSVDSEDIMTEITRIVQSGDFKEQECREEAVDDDGDALHSLSPGDEDNMDDRTEIVVGDSVNSEDITTEITRTVQSGDFKEQEYRKEAVDDDGDEALHSSRKDEDTNDETAVVIGDGVDSEDITTASATEITRSDFKEEEEECDNDSLEVKALSTPASVDETAFQELQIERHNSHCRSSIEKDMSGMLSLLGDDLDRLESETPALRRQPEEEDLIREIFEETRVPRKGDHCKDIVGTSSCEGEDKDKDRSSIANDKMQKSEDNGTVQRGDADDAASEAEEETPLHGDHTNPEPSPSSPPPVDKDSSDQCAGEKPSEVGFQFSSESPSTPERPKSSERQQQLVSEDECKRDHGATETANAEEATRESELRTSIGPTFREDQNSERSSAKMKLETLPPRYGNFGEVVSDDGGPYSSSTTTITEYGEGRRGEEDALLEMRRGSDTQRRRPADLGGLVPAVLPDDATGGRRCSHQDSLEPSPVSEEDRSQRNSPDSIEASPCGEYPCPDSLEGSPAERMDARTFAGKTTIYEEDYSSRLEFRFANDQSGRKDDRNERENTRDVPRLESDEENSLVEGDEEEKLTRRQFTPEERMFKMASRIKTFEEMEQEALESETKCEDAVPQTQQLQPLSPDDDVREEVSEKHMTENTHEHTHNVDVELCMQESDQLGEVGVGKIQPLTFSSSSVEEAEPSSYESLAEVAEWELASRPDCRVVLSNVDEDEDEETCHYEGVDSIAATTLVHLGIPWNSGAPGPFQFQEGKLFEMTRGGAVDMENPVDEAVAAPEMVRRSEDLSYSNETLSLDYLDSTVADLLSADDSAATRSLYHRQEEEEPRTAESGFPEDEFGESEAPVNVRAPPITSRSLDDDKLMADRGGNCTSEGGGSGADRKSPDSVLAFGLDRPPFPFPFSSSSQTSSPSNVRTTRTSSNTASSEAQKQWIVRSVDSDFSPDEFHPQPPQGEQQDRKDETLAMVADLLGFSWTEECLIQRLTKINRMDIVHLVESQNGCPSGRGTYADIEKTLDRSEVSVALAYFLALSRADDYYEYYEEEP